MEIEKKNGFETLLFAHINRSAAFRNKYKLLPGSQYFEFFVKILHRALECNTVYVIKFL